MTQNSTLAEATALHPILESTSGKLPATEEQLAVFQALLLGEENLIINACAGSSKTSTLVEGVNRLVHCGTRPQSILCLAFNKSIATTLSEKMPDGVRCQTLNSLGHNALRNFWPSLYLAQWKPGKILKELIPDYYDLNPGQRRALSQTLTTAKMHGVWPSKEDWKEANAQKGSRIPYPALSRKNVHSEDAESFFHSLFQSNFDLAELRSYAQLCATAYVFDILQAFSNGEITFADQIFIPATVAGISLPRFPLVFVDEAQDLSRIEQSLLKQVVSSVPRGRLIAVGDVSQAIYAFKGADPQSFQNLAEDWQALKLPLSICFRCGENIIQEARRYDSRIRPWPEAAQGLVQHLEPGEWTYAEFPANATILCRLNYPLINAAIQLILAKKSCEFMGRNMAEDYINFLELYGAKLKSLSGLWAQIRLLIEEAERRNNTREADKLDDNLRCLTALAEHYDCTTIEELKNRIMEFFSQEGNIKLATIHKAKGLEWPHVFLIRPDLLPSPRALESGDREQLQQEDNLAYVAITRAIQSFTYLE